MTEIFVAAILKLKAFNTAGTWTKGMQSNASISLSPSRKRGQVHINRMEYPGENAETHFGSKINALAEHESK